MAGEEHQRINPFLDLVAAAEKIQGEHPKNEVQPSKKAVAAQNENAYSMLGQMTGGVQGMPGMTKPKGRKRV